MAYDAHLADRIRELLEDGSDGSTVTEQKMFGGLGFLVAGRMAVAASSQGGLLVRVDPAQADRLLATTDAQPMRMKGREIRGWLHLDGAGVRTEQDLARWIAVGTAAAAHAPARRSS